MNTFYWVKRIAAMSVFSVAVTATQAGDGGPLVDNVRAANDRFREASAAVAEGYTPIPCASGQNGGAVNSAGVG